MKVSLKNQVSVQLVVGTQWGDEGKGKIVDLLSETSDIVARHQGGPNAGHTVEFGEETFILHLIPSGILRPHTQCLIGNGVVINPDTLMEEIENLESKGISVIDRLFISHNSHLILPYHKLVEKAGEESERGEKIGTTGRGIGPAYADKINRVGIRIGDLLDSDRGEEKVRQNVRMKNIILEKVYDAPGLNEDEVWESIQIFFDKIKKCIVDVSLMLHQKIKEGNKILLEGAQGTLLDIDFGTYPFVTSSNTTVGGACTGLGIGPRKIDRIIGVVKAYTTRVGNGPFPTELKGKLGEEIREIGSEYGATTGRPRRCGWFDAVIARYAIRINDIDTLAVTKLDVLDSIKEIKICTEYRYKGKTIDYFPTAGNMIEEVEPVYEVLPGWQEKISDIRRFDDLPKKTLDYLKRIEEIVEIPIGIVSVGSNREDTIWN